MKKVCLLLLLLSSESLFSESGFIRDIRIDGLWRTREYVVLREITFSTGEEFSGIKKEESLIRLRNLRLFSTVSIEEESLSDGSLLIIITVKEKWTVIPLFKAGGGGGINYLTIGAYDINILGRYLEMGMQYESLGSTNSGVFWFRDPRFLNQRLKLSGDFWQLSRNHRLYDEKAELSGGYKNKRKRVHLYMEKEERPGFLFGGGIDLSEDAYSQYELESDARILNISNDLKLPEGSTHLGTYLTVQLGQLKYNNHIVEGGAANLKQNYGFGLNRGSEDFIQTELAFKGFYLFPSRIGNIGAQLSMAQSSSDDPHFQYYLGGLDAVRGYYHEQFLTPAYWKFNLEYRVESIKSEWFVLQHIFFTDVGNTGRTLYASLADAEEPFIGYGAGIRLISPRVYRLNIRLDYGFVSGKEGPGGISFGFQHFF